MTTIEKCKYLLPCGICDRTGEKCSQQDAIKVDTKKILNEDTKSNSNELVKEYDHVLDEMLKNWKQIKPYEMHYSDWATTSQVSYSCCEHCSNNPKNGGSGICNCVLPYMESQRTGGKPATWTTTTNTTGDYVTLLNPVTSSTDWCINSTKE